MQDVNVVVVFYSRDGWTEKLALAAAVGAVQARANIRLRRIAEIADEEYASPKAADIEWADALVLGTPAGLLNRPDLPLTGAQGKPCGVFASVSQAAEDYKPALASLCEIVARGGLVLVHSDPALALLAPHPAAVESAQSYGRRVADFARSRKIV